MIGRNMDTRCKHGFQSCYSCKLEYVHATDCHYPKCEDRKTEGVKYCPRHGGTFAKHFKEEKD